MDNTARAALHDTDVCAQHILEVFAGSPRHWCIQPLLQLSVCTRRAHASTRTHQEAHRPRKHR
jgi:hypothetical protein